MAYHAAIHSTSADKEWIVELRDLFRRPGSYGIERHRQLVEKTPIGLATEDGPAASALYALLAYGADGLDAIYKIATGVQDLALAAQRALVRIAIRDASCARYIRRAESFVEAVTIEATVLKISEILNREATQLHARRLVQKLIRFCLADRAHRRSPAYLWLMTDEMDNRLEAELLVSDIIAKSVLNINDEMCDELQGLVETDSKERVYQLFLQENPAILDPLSSEIYPGHQLGSDYVTDFVIRRLDNQYTLIELEKPTDPLFTKYPQPSQQLSHALGQVLNWFALVEDYPGYIRDHGLPDIRSPRATIVIGRTTQLNKDQRRMLVQMNGLFHPRVEILTFDDVVQRARDVVRNLTDKPPIPNSLRDI